MEQRPDTTLPPARAEDGVLLADVDDDAARKAPRDGNEGEDGAPEAGSGDLTAPSEPPVHEDGEGAEASASPINPDFVQAV